MLVPTKHEKLNRNILVLGADLLSLLKSKEFNIEELYQREKISKDISLEDFLDTLLFLWLNDLILYNGNVIKLQKQCS